MEQTRCAFKVVSDPYAPEESWVPACNQVDGSTALVADRPFQLGSTSRRLILTLSLSILPAILGGAFLGQAAHVSYYLHHLFAALMYNDLSYESWGYFYYWFNQAAAFYAFIPVMFSYSVGFLGISFGLGRKAIWLGLVSVAMYFAILTSMMPTQTMKDVREPNFYLIVWTVVGVVGSFLALALGRKVATSLSSIVHPERLFLTMLAGLIPCAVLFLHDPSFLARFEVLVGLCLIPPVLIGMLAPFALRASNLKSALSLALTANSPIVLCALLHVPIGIWYVNSWSPRETFGLMAELYQYFFYCLVPLAVPIAAALLGGLQGAKLGMSLRQQESRKSLSDSHFAPAVEDSSILALTSPEFS